MIDGLRGVEHVAFTVPDVEEAMAFAHTTGMVRGLTADLDDAQRAQAFDNLREMLTANCGPDGVALDSASWLITASR